MLLILEAMLKSAFTTDKCEAGCDEAGRGCLAGPVTAAAVILPKRYKHKLLNDSKQLSLKKRQKLRQDIENDAITWAVAKVGNDEIDKINILQASYKAMHLALSQLSEVPELILVDGNRFNPYRDIPHECVVKGDGKYLSIAAASILAKTYRDDYMESLHDQYPDYHWDTNVGYPTPAHRDAIRSFGITPYHRKSFQLIPAQLELF